MPNKKHTIIWTTFFLLAFSGLWAQNPDPNGLSSQEALANPDSEKNPTDENPAQSSDENPADENPVSIQRAYRGIALEMSPDEVKERLKNDPWFNYKGEADLSLLERPRESLIDAGGSLFIKRGLFQFKSEKLIAIILELNPEVVDWYTVYTSLEQKYGSPNEINPKKAWWQDNLTRLAMERPLTVKYFDLKIIESALADQDGRTAFLEQARRDFLSEFEKDSTEPAP